MTTARNQAAQKLTRLVQTTLRKTTADKLSVKAIRLGYKEAAYIRRLIELDLGEIQEES